MSFQVLIAVAIGGALGAVGRFLVNNGIGYVFGYGFPWGTIVINIVGSFCLGVLIELFSNTYLASPEIRAFLIIGILGAFTTFSAFSLDFVNLWARNEFLLSYVYLFGSVFLGVLGFIAGNLITKTISQ